MHKLNTSSKNAVPLKCRICRAWSTTFKQLKRHLIQNHPEEEQPSFCISGSALIVVMAKDDGSVFDSGMPDTISSKWEELAIINFRFDMSLPERKIEAFFELALDLLKKNWGDVGISMNDDEVMTALMDHLNVDGILTDVKPPERI